MRVLLLVILLELFIGGGGRLTEVGPGTLRMVLFAIGVCASIVLVLRKPQSTHLGLAIRLVVLFMLINLLAFLHGLLVGREPAAVFIEMQPQLYWLLAPFFALTIDSIERVRTLARVVVVAAVTLTVGYMLGLAAVAAGLIDFEFAYSVLDTTDEFAFREGGFLFYKGFLYLCIGFVFLLALRQRLRWVLVALVGAAVVLTMTRGFLLATAFASLLLIVDAKRRLVSGLIVAAAAVPTVAFMLLGGGESGGLQAQRDISNSVRLEDIAFIGDRLDVPTLLFGQGYGALVNGRLNIENTYLWLLWKTGLVGLALWFVPLLVCLQQYHLIPRRSEHHALAAAFLYGVVLVYVQTAANPYLNNPIGLGFVMVAIFALRTIRQAHRAATVAAAPGPLPAGPAATA
jgi:hypothetical protein